MVGRRIEAAGMIAVNRTIESFKCPRCGLGYRGVKEPFPFLRAGRFDCVGMGRPDGRRADDRPLHPRNALTLITGRPLDLPDALPILK